MIEVENKEELYFFKNTNNKVIQLYKLILGKLKLKHSKLKLKYDNHL
jgi:hypothetical protein